MNRDIDDDDNPGADDFVAVDPVANGPSSTAGSWNSSNHVVRSRSQCMTNENTTARHTLAAARNRRSGRMTNNGQRNRATEDNERLRIIYMALHNRPRIALHLYCENESRLVQLVNEPIAEQVSSRAARRVDGPVPVVEK